MRSMLKGGESRANSPGGNSTETAMIATRINLSAKTSKGWQVIRLETFDSTPTVLARTTDDAYYSPSASSAFASGSEDGFVVGPKLQQSARKRPIDDEHTLLDRRTILALKPIDDVIVPLNHRPTENIELVVIQNSLKHVNRGPVVHLASLKIVIGQLADRRLTAHLQGPLVHQLLSCHARRQGDVISRGANAGGDRRSGIEGVIARVAWVVKGKSLLGIDKLSCDKF